MSWYRNDDGKIITDEEFMNDCGNCSAFCSAGAINIPCNGDKGDCPHYMEVDTSEYDKGIKDKSIDECIKIIEETVWKDADMLVNNIREYMKEGV